jgi:cytochrome c oxidase subunit II
MPLSVPRRFLITAAVTVALAVLVGVGFLAWIGTGRGLIPVTADSPNAEDIRDLYVFIGAFASFIFLVVTVPLVLFVVRFRSGGRSREVEGPQIRGNTRLELFWTVVPVLILVAIATFTFVKLSGIDNAPAAGPRGELEISVSGRRFYWQYEYPNGVVAIDRLRVPVGRVVDVGITAPEWDVIHSWWVPTLGGKRDAIPGETNHTWFKPQRTGVFDGRCGEFCGIQHALMNVTVEVMDEDEFDSWLSSERRAQQEGTSNLGRETYVGVCAKCHGEQGEGGYAAPIAGNPTFSDRDATERVIRNGVREGLRVMPPVGRDWRRFHMDAIIDYLRRNLGPQAEGGGQGTGGG